MIADLILALAAPVAGFFTALWLLLLWAGGSEAADEPGPAMEAQDQVTAEDMDGPFIPMPHHLTTRDEMVAWMTKELPKLTSELPRSRI